MGNDAINHMVDRFLMWRLPDDFHPDAGITFQPEFNVEYNALRGKPPQRHAPVGTNLFSAAQAEAMVRHMIEGVPTDPGIIGDDGLVERLRQHRIILKSGEYDGADLMRAWCDMVSAADRIEALTLKLAEAERLSKHNEALATVYQDKANEAERALADKDKRIGELESVIRWALSDQYDSRDMAARFLAALASEGGGR